MAEGVGEVELENGVLVIRRIHVVLRLKTSPEHLETAQRVHGMFADRCPVYLTLRNCIAITTELSFEEL